jgi:hypothetical protein
MMYHLFAHNEKNFVKLGDKVTAYKTKLGSIGTANGSYFAHLHHSWSDGLTVAQLRSYIKDWSVEKVKKYYKKPTCDYTKMFGRKMDVGKAGWGWLDNIGNGFHPGLDINGLGGGNSDIGYEYTSDCDGEVIYVSNTKFKDGWGKIIIIDDTIKTPTPPKNTPVAPVIEKQPETTPQVIVVPHVTDSTFSNQPIPQNTTSNAENGQVMLKESADLGSNAQKTEKVVQTKNFWQLILEIIFKIK